MTALAPNLLRVEPRGPNGYEDRSTFMVGGTRSFANATIPLTNHGATTGGYTKLTTPFYTILIRPSDGAFVVTEPATAGGGGAVLYNSTADAPPPPNAGCKALSAAQCGNGGAGVTAGNCFWMKDCGPS